MTAITNQEIISGVNNTGYSKVGIEVYFGGKQKVVEVPNAKNLSVLMPAQIPVYTDTVEKVNLEADPVRSSQSVAMQRALMSSTALTLEQIRSLPR